ncbi:AmmeMemoRadiSam system protein B [Draconibacterium sp. IB214405]|uniref:AmmeMemoRadiSam system protein B n=1 Tax=Draconibacterium sp. IB214405 TaxID=3097352 RepID=UPI002A0E20A6|nr:AmmeMemoRadiSam system protein B [Draconibacterium sp. IB214405]MDX8337941.1 AmmeMemoRadiSam system protein B [Draconibacterium sp. IB214405]
MNFSKNKNRETAVAGQFYPSSAGSLRNQLEEFFREEKEIVSSHTLRAIIAPHAGYIFSGQVAASAYQQIPPNKTYKNVFVIASSHRYSFGGASVYTRGNYETPLGEVKVNRKLAKELLALSTIFTDHTESHLYEHSLEVQLPFLQYRLDHNFQLVPIIMGTNSANDCKKLAEALQPYFTTDNLFVVSTDFSHFPNYDDACKVDQLTADSICQNNADELLDTLGKTKKEHINHLSTSLCGWTSVLTLLYLTQNNNFMIKQLDYKNSGDSKLYGEKDRVVGYWALAVYEKPAFSISPSEKHDILQLARNTISRYLGKDTEKIKKAEKGQSILDEKAGAFISVYIDNELRGCIGGFAGEKTLREMISRHAVSAVNDHRFDPVEPIELDRMTLEVSVLTPLKKISSIDEFELGRHGIYIKSGFNSGTFLPQVAEKTGWSKEEFLGRCSQNKAGIGWEGWKTAELFTYEVAIVKDDHEKIS